MSSRSVPAVFRLSRDIEAVLQFVLFFGLALPGVVQKKMP